MSKVIILDSIRSMQNVWAIFRNADGSWFEKIYLCGHTPTPPRRDISKTALWAQNTIDWEYYSEIMDVIKDLKDKNYKIISVEITPQAQDYKTLFWYKEKNIALVLWNEINWVSKKVLINSDKHVIIPMLWNKNSLNVSVAAWIVMYALL